MIILLTIVVELQLVPTDRLRARANVRVCARVSRARRCKKNSICDIFNQNKKKTKKTLINIAIAYLAAGLVVRVQGSRDRGRSRNRGRETKKGRIP